MSTLAIIALIVLAYIVQVLLMLAYPYYKYRQNYKEHKDRTIGKFVKFTNCTIGDGYMLVALFPIIGLAAFILTLIIGCIVVGLQSFYDKVHKRYKNIKK